MQLLRLDFWLLNDAASPVSCPCCDEPNQQNSSSHTTLLPCGVYLCDRNERRLGRTSYNKFPSCYAVYCCNGVSIHNALTEAFFHKVYASKLVAVPKVELVAFDDAFRIFYGTEFGRHSEFPFRPNFSLVRCPM